MARELFPLYATGAYSMKQIETPFWEKVCRNHNGKKIAHATMSGMIATVQVQGLLCGQQGHCPVH